MKNANSRVLLAASVAGILAAAGSAWLGQRAQAAETAASGKVPCYGINKCKGAGACGGKGHSCAGNNACKAQGFISLEKDTCLKIESGRLTVDAPAKS